mgnify:CR=1 FL=1
MVLVKLSKILSRYYKSLTNAALIIKTIDRAYIYDNSIDDVSPQLIFRTVDGKIAKKYVEEYPEWTKVFFNILNE